jgi:hypothetical protein
MGGTGVGDVWEKGRGWIRSASRRLEARRRRLEARRIAREAQGHHAAIGRSWIEAELAARLAARAGLRAEDFLRARLARYAAALPMPLEALGVDVRMENGEPVVRARVKVTLTGERAAPWAPAPHEQRELDHARAEVRTLGERASAARERVDALQRSVADDLASGKLAANPELLEASPEQRGRPPVPPGWPQAFLNASAAALLGAAALRMSAPAMALAGLSADELGYAFRTAPLPAGAALLFGLAAAVSVFAFLHVAAERGLELLRGASTTRRPAVLALAGGAAVALSSAVALAAVRPGQLVTPLLLVVVPLGAVFLVRQSRALAAGRAEALAAALEWDRSQARNAGERARRGEGIARAEAMLAAAVRELALAEERLRALEERTAEDARTAAALAVRAERRTERLAESLAAALELDRYAFLRRAAAIGLSPATGVRPFRSRPSPLDPGVGGPLEAAG